MTAKYVKILLACFYLLQVVVIFRESIVKLYEKAADTIHREGAAHAPEAATPIRERMAPVLADPIAVIAPAQPFMVSIATVIMPRPHAEEEPHPPHEPQKKDRVRKMRSLLAGFRLLDNLFHRYRISRCTGTAISMNIVGPLPRQTLAA